MKGGCSQIDIDLLLKKFQQLETQQQWPICLSLSLSLSFYLPFGHYDDDVGVIHPRHVHVHDGGDGDDVRPKHKPNYAMLDCVLADQSTNLHDIHKYADRSGDTHLYRYI